MSSQMQNTFISVENCKLTKSLEKTDFTIRFLTDILKTEKIWLRGQRDEKVLGAKGIGEEILSAILSHLFS